MQTSGANACPGEVSSRFLDLSSNILAKSQEPEYQENKIEEYWLLFTTLGIQTMSLLMQ